MMETHMKRKALAGVLLCHLLLLSACSFNPFVPYNDTTGSTTSTLVGAGAGAGAAALGGMSKWWIGAGGIAGGAIGYYSSTLRFQSGGIIQNEGQVYQVGQTIGIYIPADSLFEPNTTDFRPYATDILNSAATVLARAPDNNIIISGNTAGFDRPGRELWLSEKRAEKVSAYLWNSGVTQFKNMSNDTRKLVYVGYGDYFPISQHYTNKGIRENSRIQIVSYATDCTMKIDARHMALTNPGAVDNSVAIASATRTNCRWDKFGNPIDCFDGEG